MKIFGEKPSPKQIMERYKRIVYQIKKNMIPTKSNWHMPKVKTPPPLDLNIDLGNWLSSAKIFVLVIEILKVPSQRDILMKTLAEPKENIVEKSKETITEKPKEKLVSSKENVKDKPKEDLSKKQSNFNEDVPIILHSRFPNKEDHPAFYISLIAKNKLK